MRRNRECENSRLAWLAPPIRPTSISGKPTVDLSDTTIRSHEATMASPAPSAAPLTAATTGFVHSRIV